MSDPKDQHHIPKMILKRFAISNKMQMFDKHAFALKANRNIDSIARRRHLYTTFQNGNKCFEMEKMFGSMESQMSQYLDFSDKLKFDDIDSNLFIEFISHLMIRTPEYVDLTNSLFKDFKERKKLKAELSMLKNDIEADKVIEEFSEKGNVFKTTFKNSWEDVMAKLVNNFDLVLNVIEMGNIKPVLNDRYRILEPLSDPEKEKKKGIEWWKFNVRIHCPISARIYLTFVPKTDNIGSTRYKFAANVIPQQYLSKLNRLSSSQASKYIYCSCDNSLVRSL